jgi:long-chain acyl-CoA synthetase
VEIRILDGEVAVRSPAQTSGYSDMDELNREAFGDGFFLTGDLGSLDERGRLTITGRTKLLIEVGGYKVDPIEVADVVEAHPGVREAVIVGVDGREGADQLVKAVVVPDGQLEEADLIAFCQERLANYKVPRVVEVRDEIPRSPLGKVLRKYLV